MMIRKLVKEVAVSLFDHGCSYRYDQGHRRCAELAYKSIIEQRPDRELNNRNEFLIREYAVEVLGSLRFAPWLRTYTAFHGSFEEGWMPDNYFGRVVMPASVSGYSGVSARMFLGIAARTLSRRILATDRLPDIAYYVNGTWIDVSGKNIPRQKIAEILFSRADHVFVKQEASSRGRGVFKIDFKDYDVNRLEALGNLVVQAPIQQADFFNEIVRGSVAALRITTVKVRGLPAEKRASYLRIGRAAEGIVASRTALRIPIVDEIGSLGQYAALPDWKTCREHPDTGFRFERMVVPEFRRAVSLCIGLHNVVPHVMVIGWDVSIDVDGEPVLMEWNINHPDVKFSEAATGPCFRGLGWEHARQGRSHEPGCRGLPVADGETSCARGLGRAARDLGKVVPWMQRVR